MLTNRFTESGIKLESGQELKADMIVTATGLRLNLFGGIPLSVDGKLVKANEQFMYKGIMLSGKCFQACSAIVLML